MPLLLHKQTTYMGSENICVTDLTLGLGFSSSSSSHNNYPTNNNSNSKTSATTFELSLNLCLSCEALDQNMVQNKLSTDYYLYGHQDSCGSSYQSNELGSTKRERVIMASRVLMMSDEEHDDGSNVVRKKHRLSESQSSLLEESFKQNTTLNPKQKQHLARELNLRPRQVEVWFQNRRARTKLKQIEADYELLKKCCDKLTDENTKLHKELHQLKQLKLVKPSLYMQLPPPPPETCPSCERISGAAICKATKKCSYNMTPNPHFYDPVKS